MSIDNYIFRTKEMIDRKERLESVFERVLKNEEEKMVETFRDIAEKKSTNRNQVLTKSIKKVLRTFEPKNRVEFNFDTTENNLLEKTGTYVVVVESAKGGVCKTTSAKTIAFSCAEYVSKYIKENIDNEEVAKRIQALRRKNKKFRILLMTADMNQGLRTHLTKEFLSSKMIPDNVEIELIDIEYKNMQQKSKNKINAELSQQIVTTEDLLKSKNILINEEEKEKIFYIKKGTTHVPVDLLIYDLAAGVNDVAYEKPNHICVSSTVKDTTSIENAIQALRKHLDDEERIFIDYCDRMNQIEDESERGIKMLYKNGDPTITKIIEQHGENGFIKLAQRNVENILKKRKEQIIKNGGKLGIEFFELEDIKYTFFYTNTRKSVDTRVIKEVIRPQLEFLEEEFGRKINFVCVPYFAETTARELQMNYLLSEQDKKSYQGKVRKLFQKDRVLGQGELSYFKSPTENEEYIKACKQIVDQINSKK